MSLSSFSAPTTIIVDASITARAILPLQADHDLFLNLFNDWHRQKSNLIAPEIWLPEVVSVIRQMIYLGAISDIEGTIAVDDIFRLGVEIMPTSIELCHSALSWSEKLKHSKAYDGFYIALAEYTHGQLATADRRLANATREAGGGFVRWIGEEAG